jgi:hypothetical protein
MKKIELKTLDKTEQRQELIRLCERSIVDITKWGNRDTSHAQERVGILWSLLKANCLFEIEIEREFIYVTAWSLSFRHFDGDDVDWDNKETLTSQEFRLATNEHLDWLAGRDWC